MRIVVLQIAVGGRAKLRKCKSTSALNQADSAGNHLKKVAAEILDWKIEETQVVMSGALEVGHCKSSIWIQGLQIIMYV